MYFGSTFIFYIIFYLMWSPKPESHVALDEDEEKEGLVKKEEKSN